MIPVNARPGRLYHPATYYLAKVSVSLPFNILVILSFQLITYGMVGLRHSPDAVAKSCLIAVLMGLISFQVGGRPWLQPH